MEKLENLKNLHAQIPHKGDFAQIIADYYGLKKRYVKETYFQGKWQIPPERVATITDIAQKIIKARIDTLQYEYDKSK